jgi:hypothetical protein
MQPTPAEQVQLLFVRNEGAIRAFVRALQPSLADADDVFLSRCRERHRRLSQGQILLRGPAASRG